MDINEKLVKTTIEPVYDEMESPSGLSNFEDLLATLQGKNIKESYDLEELFNNTTDLLFLNDIDGYKEYLQEIKNEGKLDEFIEWCQNNLGYDKEDLKLDLIDTMDECDGGGASAAAGTVSSAGGFSAQLGPAPTAAGATLFGQPVEGKSVKFQKKKKK